MREKVLVVDDEPAVLAVMGRILTIAGYESSTAACAEDALTMMGSTRFDAALVDKNLGGMDGLELVSHVRRRQPRCACIMMTGYASTESAVRALRLGVVDFLEKPSPELDVVADRVQLAIKTMRLQEERDGLHKRVAELEGQLRAKEHELSAASIGEHVHAEVSEMFRRRDEQLIRGAEDLLAAARLLPKSDRVCAQIEAHLVALRG